MTKFLGITDEITGCDCCGKTNLKRTVVLDIDGEVVHYGCDCASKALYGSKKKAAVVLENATAVQVARNWIAKGYSLEVVARGIWNRFGYSVEVKSDGLHIGSFGVVL